MQLRLPLLLSIPFALLSCADDAPSSTPVDAAPAIDATPVCDVTDYPRPVRPVSLSLTEPITLRLDGTGTRCEQVVRALFGPARPAPLDQLDVTGITETECHHDDPTGYEIVTVRADNYAGVPNYGPVQDVIVHVDADNQLVILNGDFVPAGAAPAPGCLDDGVIAGLVPGHELAYRRYALCLPQEDGAYTIAADDEIEVQAEGVYLDEANQLHRVRAVDVYLAASHVDDAIGNSDAFCCNGTTDHCVGKRLFIDTYTGAVVGQAPHCHIC